MRINTLAPAKVIGALLIYEHALLRDDLDRLSVAFFNINGYIAIAALVFTIAGVWVA